MAIRIDESLGLRNKLARVMFSMVVVGRSNFRFFSGKKSRRRALGGNDLDKALILDQFLLLVIHDSLI